MTEGLAGRDGLGRSVGLLRAFKVEQTEPDHFYAALAEDSVRTVERFGPVAGRTVLDVGAGPVQFANAFVAAGARYVAVDADPTALSPTDLARAYAVVGRGERLPVANAVVDVALASNVFEHARRPNLLGDELVRVTRPGGLIVVSYTNWLSPWGGHETSPFHYLGGRRAIRIYERRYGRVPKNRVGENLFRVSVADGLRWARTQDGTRILDARPRYYPDWARFLVKVPGLREVATWNLLLVLRRT